MLLQKDYKKYLAEIIIDGYTDTDGDYDYDETVATLSRIFGIVGICPVELHEDEGFDKLCEAVIEHINHVYKDKSFTFKVNARRARKNYPMTSMEINAAVGEKVLEAFPETRVDVHNPQVMINIEIRPMINIYSEEIPGPGGMPLGTAGKAMLLLSGGIGQPGCRYMIAKRGGGNQCRHISMHRHIRVREQSRRL